MIGHITVHLPDTAEAASPQRPFPEAERMARPTAPANENNKMMEKPMTFRIRLGPARRGSRVRSTLGNAEIVSARVVSEWNKKLDAQDDGGENDDDIYRELHGYEC